MQQVRTSTTRAPPPPHRDRMRRYRAVLIPVIAHEVSQGSCAVESFPEETPVGRKLEVGRSDGILQDRDRLPRRVDALVFEHSLDTLRPAAETDGLEQRPLKLPLDAQHLD